jgi:hypothetical protein
MYAGDDVKLWHIWIGGMKEWLHRQSALVLDSVQKSATYRDGVLVIGAVLYGIGYIAWSIYAWNNQLGLLPVLSAQYVATGLAVGVVVLVGGSFAAALWPSRRYLHQRIFPPSSTDSVATKAARQVLIAAAPVSFGVLIFARSRFPDLARELFWICAVIVFYAPDSGWLGRITGRINRIMLTVYIVVLSGLVADRALDKLPAQFGGVHPICAYLDVDLTKLSEEMQRELLPPSAKRSPGIVRTNRLEVLFSGSGSIMVRRDGDTARRVYEFGDTLVTAKADCVKEP